MKHAKFQLIPALLVLAAVSSAAGYWLGRPDPDSLTAIISYPQPKPIEPFELIGDTGTRFANSNLQGQWDLVFFGFTHCPDICPSTLNMIRGIRKTLLPELGHSRLPAVTLISVDPERDDAASLQRYIEHFDPAFRAVTGTSEQLTQFARQLNIAFSIQGHVPGETNYNVDHFAGIFLINPEAQVHGIFTPPLDPAAIASDLKVLLRG